MRTLDYSALTAPLTKEDYKSLSQSANGTSDKAQLIVGGVIAIVAVSLAVLVGLSGLLRGNGIGSLMPVVFFLSFLLPMAAVVAYTMVSRRRRLARLNKFAHANGLTFRHDLPPSGYGGMIFDNGHTRQVMETLLFPDGLEIGNYQYVTGSGKNRSTHTFGFVRVALSRHVPHMVLDARQNNFLGLTNLPDSFDRSQRLTLEGNFNDHFDVYVPKQYERDALYVFTPDVMQALIDHGRKYDIEVVDSELYLYSPAQFKLLSEVSLKELLTVVDTLKSELVDQTKRYSDERAVGAQPGTAVAEAGRRLKQGWNPFAIGIILFVIVFNFSDVLVPREFQGMFYLGLFGLIAVFIIGKLLTRQRL